MHPRLRQGLHVSGSVVWTPPFCRIRVSGFRGLGFRGVGFKGLGLPTIPSAQSVETLTKANTRSPQPQKLPEHSGHVLLYTLNPKPLNPKPLNPSKHPEHLEPQKLPNSLGHKNRLTSEPSALKTLALIPNLPKP